MRAVICVFVFFSINQFLSSQAHEGKPHPIDPLPCLGENEQFNMCASACPRTCDNLNTQVFCIRPCVARCDCIPGYVRDRNGDCIDPALCPIKKPCPPNQEMGCVHPCVENTCENSYYNGMPLFLCKRICILGCVCKKGFVYKSSTKRCCIPKKKCPVCCASNREFKECGPITPKSCDNLDEEIRSNRCNRGCFCKEGLVEDNNGNCIPPERCPSKCGTNELEDPCVNPCQPTCAEPNPHVCQFLVCNKGCVCKPPYIRNQETNECVHITDCP